MVETSSCYSTSSLLIMKGNHMKTFVRRLCRVFLIIGITGLLTLIGGATTLSGSPPAAHANSSNCPSGYHVDQNNQNCDPNAAYYCPSGQIWSQDAGDCVAPNPSQCTGQTWQDPDNASQCLPVSQPCGSASTYDATSGYCIVPAPVPVQ